MMMMMMIIPVYIHDDDDEDVLYVFERVRFTYLPTYTVGLGERMLEKALDFC